MKKGFTLVEVIAVLAVLAILLTITVPGIIGVFDEKKEVLYNTTIEEIERFSKMYLTENPDLYTTIEEDGYVDITTAVLCDNKYVSCPIKDPKDNSDIEGYVRVTISNGDYVYNFVRN